MNKPESSEELQTLDADAKEVRKLVKICGLKYAVNIREIISLNPDFIGFIFHSKSPRYVEPFPTEILRIIPSTIKKTGVFVNEDIDDILTAVHKYQLDAVQIHGSEMEKVCRKLRETGLTIIKAFPIESASNFIPTQHYEGLCDYFLFDTKSVGHGGSGIKFNWNILHEYKGKTPFFLSGGISQNDVNAILKIDHPLLAGIDLNSKFELKPGMKNVENLKEFLVTLKSESSVF